MVSTGQSLITYSKVEAVARVLRLSARGVGGGGLPVILVNLIPEDEAETSIASYDRAASPDYPIAILLFLFISSGVGALVGDSISAVLRVYSRFAREPLE